MKKVLVFRDHLGYPSETFVSAQAERLTRYAPTYLCSRLVAAQAVRTREVLVANQGGLGVIAEARFKLRGRLPRRISGAIERAGVSLIHAHFGPDGALILPVARRRRLPLVVTFHGFDVSVRDAAVRLSDVSHRLYLRRQRQLREEAALLLTDSSFLREKLIAKGFPPAKVRTHYIGVDLSRFSPVDGPRDRSVLFVGRMFEGKGPLVLVRAMAALPERDRVPIVFAGDGPAADDVRRLAGELSVRVEMRGWQTPDQVRDLMRKAMVLCAPSAPLETGLTEGFGLVLIEAQACATPVVASAIGGIPEAVADGITGLLVPPRDHAILGAQIHRLLTDRGLWSRLSGSAPRFVQDNFDLDRQVAALEGHYDDVLASV